MCAEQWKKTDGGEVVDRHTTLAQEPWLVHCSAAACTVRLQNTDANIAAIERLPAHSVVPHVLDNRSDPGSPDETRGSAKGAGRGLKQRKLTVPGVHCTGSERGRLETAHIN